MHYKKKTNTMRGERVRDREGERERERERERSTKIARKHKTQF